MAEGGGGEVAAGGIAGPPLDVVAFLSETTWVSVIRAIRRGERVGILAVAPRLPMLRPLLTRWLAWQNGRGRLVDIQAERRDLMCRGDFITFRQSHAHFPAAEPFLERHFRFAEAERRFGRYAQAFRHVVCLWTDYTPFLAFSLATILASHGQRPPRFLGIPAEVIEIYRFHLGEPAPPLRQGRAPTLSWLFNPLQTLVALAYALIWIAARTRWRAPVPREVFTAIDFVDNFEREGLLWEELTDSPAPNLVIYRTRHLRKTMRGKVAGFGGLYDELPSCGRFGPGQALAAAGEACRDTLALAFAAFDLYPHLFWYLLKLPARRMLWRGLFNRYRCRNFWARDDYASEHIVRTWELHRIGGRHFGRLHGLPVAPPRIAQYAYVDLDVYYIYGDDYRRFYAPTWPESVEIKAVGAYGMARAGLHRLAEARPDNIVIFLSTGVQTAAVIAGIRAFAQSFSDRIVYIKPRPADFGGHTAALMAEIAEGPDNIRVIHDPADDCFFLGNYVVSEPSTPVSEGVQYGLVTFALIMENRFKEQYLLRWPDLVVSSWDQAAERIRAVEAGTWRYPREAFADLTDLSGRVMWDVVRQDMGLAPKETAPLRHLAFVGPGSESP